MFYISFCFVLSNAINDFFVFCSTTYLINNDDIIVCYFDSRRLTQMHKNIENNINIIMC